ncbi:nickel/cobalt transporter [Consotaella aegiceratis]|uniref:nickel/cobalt transporter n=1 Tax=Consotaella aegiceratis TaxID=3097961 RepID=UPI002F406822
MRLIRSMAWSGLLLVLLAGPALAKSSLGIGSADASLDASQGVSGYFLWITAYQREFFSALRHALVALKQGPAGLPLLVGISFAYGIFHAAGPGHGKAVISSYMLANEVQLRRGVILSFASALVQALSALLVVGAGWYLLRGTSISMTAASDALEVASFGLIALFGLVLFVRKAIAIWRRHRPAVALAFEPRLVAVNGAMGRGSIMPRASNGLASDVCTADEVDCACGRPHMADPKALSGRRLRFGTAASAVLSVGLRPCSGAIVVLTFALMNGLYLAGLLSVLAMAVGTAITVSALAVLAVFAKDTALRLSGRGGFGGVVRDVMELGAALVLMLLGTTLVIGMLSLP